MRCKEFSLLLKMLGIVGMTFALTACSGNNGQSKSARDTGFNPDNGDDSTHKPDPATGKIVEKFKALQFQKPTQEEAEFLNSMELDLTAGDRAFFSFSYAPDEEGTFYFSLAQARLHLQGCKKAPDRSYKMRIFWQQIQGKKRVIVKEFSPNIESFDFRAGNKYILSYALMDLKEFSDCQSATLKFASFLKNYK
ncbi:MAG TPA: hypothetical protein VIG33_10945 [Pseudobdellovibrionaceae bacterium]|jgi:hypothetical protein